MTIYGDVLFIVNLYVDFFLLWCTRRTLHLQGKSWRLVAGASVGALCAFVCLFPQPWWVSMVWGGISAGLVTGCAFFPLSPRGLLRAALCFWAYSLLLAGFFLFFIQWGATSNIAVVGHAVYLGISPVLLFLFTAGAYLVFWLFQKIFHREDLTQKICHLEIHQEGKSVELWAKADTGCVLREPFSGLPVIVCQASSVEPLFPDPVIRALHNDETPSLEGIRLIPFHSVGGSGVLPAFRPEKVCRLPEGTPLPCYIALWNQTFPSGQYQALYCPDQFPQ